MDWGLTLQPLQTCSLQTFPDLHAYGITLHTCKNIAVYESLYIVICPGSSRAGFEWPSLPQIHRYSTNISMKSFPRGHWMLVNLRHHLLPLFCSSKIKRNIFFPCYAHLEHSTKACLRQSILQKLSKLFCQWFLEGESGKCSWSKPQCLWFPVHLLRASLLPRTWWSQKCVTLE